MSLPSPWESLRADDMPAGGLRVIARRLGPQVAASVWKSCRGTRIEPPQRFPRDFMIRYIQEHWDGTNAAELARALEVHQRTVERMLDAAPAAKKPEPRQLSFI